MVSTRGWKSTERNSTSHSSRFRRAHSIGARPSSPAATQTCFHHPHTGERAPFKKWSRDHPSRRFTSTVYGNACAVVVRSPAIFISARIERIPPLIGVGTNLQPGSTTPHHGASSLHTSRSAFLPLSLLPRPITEPRRTTPHQNRRLRCGWAALR